jgi:hypothetical protein
VWVDAGFIQGGMRTCDHDKTLSGRMTGDAGGGEAWSGVTWAA